LLLIPYFLGISQGGFFIENKGQFPDNVLFNAKLNCGEFFIEKDGSFNIKVLSPNQLEAILGHKHQEEIHKHCHPKREIPKNFIKGHTFKVKFIKANFSKDFSSKLAGNFKINHFHGQCYDQWVSNLNPYSEIILKNVYPKIDLKVYIKNNSVKYEFILHESAETENIKIQYLGLEEINFTPARLTLKTSVGNITDENPKSYYLSNPSKNIETKFQKINSNTFTLKTKVEKVTECFVIDPQLNFSSFTGAMKDNWGYTATYDEDGHAYAGGVSFNGGYPTTLGSFQSAYGGGTIDMAISKFSPDGSKLIYSTYIGGSGLEAPHSMVVNSKNELIIYGITGSTNYPVTTNAYDRTFNGGTSSDTVSNVFIFNRGTDIAITKLSPDGNTILGSTYYGGSGNDALNDPDNSSGLSRNYADDYRGEVTTDNQNSIFISSVTSSNNLPTPNGFQTTYGGGNQDGCVAKFNQDLSAIIWGSYFGGNRADACYSSKQNSRGETYITGGSNSTNLTLNGRSNKNNGGIDGFIARISANGSNMINGTFIGTSSYDQSYFVEIDFEDKIYCFGQSLGNMPTTEGVYKNENSKQFLQKYSEDLFTLESATVIGSGDGRINIVPGAFMVSNCKEVYLSGWGGVINGDPAGTKDMPISKDAYQKKTDGSDFYFMLLGPDFSYLKYGSYFGGSTLGEHVDGGTSRFDKNGTIYQAVCAGCGSSSAFPTTPTAHSRTNNSNNCNLAIVKMDISKTPRNSLVKDTICEEETPTYLFYNYSDYIVSELNKKPFNLNDDSIYFPKNTQDTYYISTISSCGNSIDTFNLSLTKIDEISSPDTLICPGSRFNLFVKGGEEYYWSSPELKDNANDSSIIIYPHKNQIYTNIIYKGKCIAYDTVKVTVIPSPPQNIEDEYIIYFGNDFSASLNPEFQYTWTPYEFLNCNDCNTIYGSPDKDITYHFSYSDNKTCQFTDSIVVKVIFPVYIPNTFTPNGDNKNEIFKAESEILEKYELLIYDRWGNLAFQTKNLSTGWDGKINGNPQPQDVYVYKLRYMLRHTRNWQEKVGIVSLIR